MSQPRRLLIPLVLTLCGLMCGCLSGCSGVFHSTAPPLQLYVLQPPAVPLVTAAGGAGSGAAPTAPAVTADSVPTLRIALPLAAPGLNTDRIALLRTGSRLDYYAGSRWSASLPELVSDLQVAVFRAGTSWRAVADARTSLNADYLLQTSVDQFAADYATESGPPLIRVGLHCLLLRRSDGMLLASFAVTQTQQAQENRMASVVAAFSVAADQAVIDVAGQASAVLRSAKSPAPP